jgi:hypothetical protein
MLARQQQLFFSASGKEWQTNQARRLAESLVHFARYLQARMRQAQMQICSKTSCTNFAENSEMPIASANCKRMA